MHPWDVLNLLDRGAFPSAPGLPLYAPHTSQWEQPWRCSSFASLAGAEPALGWQRSQGSWREKHRWTNRAELGQAFWPPSFNHQVVRVSSCTLGGCRDQQRFPTCSIFQTCLKSTVSSIRAWQTKHWEQHCHAQILTWSTLHITWQQQQGWNKIFLTDQTEETTGNESFVISQQPQHATRDRQIRPTNQVL